MEVPRWCRRLRISGVAAAVVQVATAVAWVRFLVQELLHVEGVKKKKKKNARIGGSVMGYDPEYLGKHSFLLF